MRRDTFLLADEGFFLADEAFFRAAPFLVCFWFRFDDFANLAPFTVSVHMTPRPDSRQACVGLTSRTGQYATGVANPQWCAGSATLPRTTTYLK